MLPHIINYAWKLLCVEYTSRSTRSANNTSTITHVLYVHIKHPYNTAVSCSVQWRHCTLCIWLLR